jgi:hypothetical protein
MNSLLSLFQFAIGCHHRQLSGVFAINKLTYQVCLNCGQEFEYSWTLMHSVQSRVASRPPVRRNDTVPDEPQVR